MLKFGIGLHVRMIDKCYNDGERVLLESCGT